MGAGVFVDVGSYGLLSESRDGCGCSDAVNACFSSRAAISSCVSVAGPRRATIFLAYAIFTFAMIS